MQQGQPHLLSQAPTNHAQTVTATQNGASDALASTAHAVGTAATTSAAGDSCGLAIERACAAADGTCCAALSTAVMQPSPLQDASAHHAAAGSPAAAQAAEQDSACKAPRHSASATFADSSDLEDSSSEVSSSVSPVDRHLSLESLEIYDNGAFAFDPSSEQEQLQHVGQSLSGSADNQQPALQQQQQPDGSGGLQHQGSNQQPQQHTSSSWAGYRQSSDHASRNQSTDARLADPDYEVPQGKLTETQVLLSHADKLHLDRYGFIVTQEEAASKAARVKRSTAQTRRDQRHVHKWRRMLGSSRDDFKAYWASRPKKVKRRVRKGIPDEFRGLVWQYLSGGRELMQQHPVQYAQLLTITNDAVDMEIMRDLNRTFPNHVFFHQRQGPGQQSLFHVLRAYSAYDSTVGYVQGMGFVTAILLMYMSEEEAFWTLVALLKGTTLHPPLEGMYQAGMPLLQQCLYQFQELLKQENPKLGSHLEQEGVVPSMYCTHWFNTIFAYSLPFEQLLRVWDVFLLEGMKVVFRVGIVLLSSAQEQLIAMPFEKLVGQLNSKTKFPVLSRHPDVLIRAALRISVSRRLEALRETHQHMIAEAEAAAAASSCRSDGSSRHANGSQHFMVTPVNMGPKE